MTSSNDITIKKARKQVEDFKINIFQIWTNVYWINGNIFFQTVKQWNVALQK